MAATAKKRAALQSDMGRPSQGSLSSFAEPVVRHLRRLRQQHPGWGPLSLRVELEQLGALQALRLPSYSSIARYLNQQGWVRTYEAHSKLPRPQWQQPEQAHALWQVDAQGNEWVADIGWVSMLNVKDVYSGLYVACLPVRLAGARNHPTALDYQTVLRLGFIQHGLPAAIQVDHASVFYENTTKSPFPTRFHLWVLSLDITLYFSRVRRPTDQAHVERSHQTLFHQVLRDREPFTSYEHLYRQCQLRRQRLNADIPSQATAARPPLQHDPLARHSRRYYHPLREAERLNYQRVYDFLAQGQWFRRVASSNTVSLGKSIYYLAAAKPKTQLRITFCACCQHLLFHDDKERLCALVPLKNLTLVELMGDLAPLCAGGPIPLELPLDWSAQKLSTTLWDLT